MSPIRFERNTVLGDVITQVTKRSENSFDLDAYETAQLLGVEVGAITHRDGPDVKGLKKRGFNAIKNRRYGDDAILRIASETKVAKITKHEKTGLTQVTSSDTWAILDKPWESAQRWAEIANTPRKDEYKFYNGSVSHVVDGRTIGTWRDKEGVRHAEFVPEGVKAMARVGGGNPLPIDHPLVVQAESEKPKPNPKDL